MLYSVAAITRRYPLLSGRGTLANTKLFKRFTWSDEIAIAPTFGGDVFVPLNDYVGRAAFFFGDLDPKLTWILKRIIKPGDTVADIGANLGVVTVAMSKLVGPPGSVLAFEPNPNLRVLLDRTIERNRIKNVQLHSFALGDKDDELNLHVPVGNLGGASLVRSGGTSVRVPVRRLDDVTSQPISLMKIDVEGFEVKVLRGAVNTLRNRPVLVLEANDATQNDALLSFLRPFGYEFLSIPRCLLRMRTTWLTEWSHDIVAVPAGRADVLKQLRLSERRS